MNGVSLGRRSAIAFVALLVSAVLFRSQVAQALVTRGDDALRIGDTGAGIRYYRRALALDAGSVVAADRLAFYLTMHRGPGDARAAAAIATSVLARVPDATSLLVDRALAEQQLRHWTQAESDFERAGSVARDPRYHHFAGRIALRLGRRDQAKRFFTRALLADPHFSPARVALGALK